MPTPVAALLNRPETTLSFVLNGASGSRLLLSSIPAPAPLAHQWSGLTPLPMKRAEKRLGNAVAAPPAACSTAKTRIDSSQGNAIATPTPRRSVRRSIELLLRFMRRLMRRDGWFERANKERKKLGEQIVFLFLHSCVPYFLGTQLLLSVVRIRFLGFQPYGARLV